MFASCFTVTPILLDHVLCISTPMKDSARITHVYRDLPLQFDDKIRSVNALPLDMCEFDFYLWVQGLLAAHLSSSCIDDLFWSSLSLKKKHEAGASPASKGITMDPAKVEAITEWPRTTSCDEYGVFLD
ncbi:hypothetical protein Tco_0071306 [Tanacetum coccineum]